LAFADESQSICKLKAKKSTEERQQKRTAAEENGSRRERQQKRTAAEENGSRREWQQKRMAAEENGSTNKPIEEGEIHAEVI
jgi:hypothetical protein